MAGFEVSTEAILTQAMQGRDARRPPPWAIELIEGLVPSAFLFGFLVGGWWAARG